MRKERVFLLFVAVAMLCLELLDAFTLSDDILYRFVWQEDDAAPVRLVQSAADLIESQWAHYHITNGRWVMHTLAQAFLSFVPPVIYHVLNALLFALMLYLGSCLVVKRDRRLFSMVTMFFLLFVVFADVRTTMLWSLGTFNYLWVLVMTLSFLLYLRRVRHSSSRIHWLVAPLSLFIGCSHEALSLPLAITLIVYMLAELRKKEAYPCALYIAWYAAGTLTILLSPALWSRAGDGITLMSRMISGAVNIVFNLKVLWLLVVTTMVTARNRHSYWKKTLYLRRYFYLCLLLALGIVVVCGTNLERVVFFADFIAMLLLVDLLAAVVAEKWQKRLMIACCAAVVVYYIPAVLVRYENDSNCRYMQQQMAEQGREVVAVRYPVDGEQPVKDFFRRRFVNPTAEFGVFCSYMGFNARDINMRCAATLYGKQQMIFLPEDVVQRIESDSTAYRNYELDRHQSLYVWQLPEDKPVKKIVFELLPEDVSALSLPQRLLAYKDDTYELDDDFHYSVVHVNGRPYLVFTRPTANISRRIGRIRY